jgi:hypothetical protein
MNNHQTFFKFLNYIYKWNPSGVGMPVGLQKENILKKELNNISKLLVERESSYKTHWTLRRLSILFGRGKA